MKLTDLKGIGKKTEEAFALSKVLSAEDLLEFFPRDFESFEEPSAVSEIGYRTFASVKGAFCGKPHTRASGRLKITSAKFQDEAGSAINVTWFNAPYMENAVKTDRLYILRGKVSHKYSLLQLVQPKMYSPADYEAKQKSLSPVYPSVKGVKQGIIVKAVQEAFESDAYEAAAVSNVPRSVEEKFSLMHRRDALFNMHFPADTESCKKAAERFSFEEIFFFALHSKLGGKRARQKSNHIIKPDERTDAFKESLPFTLTNAQERVLFEIRSDMQSGFSMNRLVQGDVGSGKTIVALLAMMDAAYAGFQAALMAPTEVLAVQHFQKISSLLKEKKSSLNAALLTGSLSASEKQVIYNALEDGKTDIIIGTHALFQEKVNYKNLALVITDEQHRFGTAQRKALTQKGDLPHMLVMSATPIPRTLALIIYGGMDISAIDESPLGRLPVKNAVIDDSYKKKAYDFILREIRKGRQAYIICPMIDYVEGLDVQNVTDYTEMLRDIMPEDIKIAQLTGKTDAAEKTRVMDSFKEGKTDILVATTVIEVGVDVPNASVMMIEDAERFGLSTLHQLRGRVGRGSEQSYCIFACHKASKEAKERLNVLRETNDGFKIAEKDLSMRGPGEFSGIRQSGMISFKCFDPVRDGKIALNAAEAAADILKGRAPVTEPEKKRIKDSLAKTEDALIL